MLPGFNILLNCVDKSLNWFCIIVLVRFQVTEQKLEAVVQVRSLGLVQSCSDSAFHLPRKNVNVLTPIQHDIAKLSGHVGPNI